MLYNRLRSDEVQFGDETEGRGSDPGGAGRGRISFNVNLTGRKMT